MPDQKEVNRMFGGIANRYDLANHLLSFGVDFFWRRTLTSLVRRNEPSFVLDLATGSGDVAFCLKKRLPEEVNVMGMDFCRPMLEIAEKKKARRKWAEGICFEYGDCLEIPLESELVDVITISFGIRNLEDRARGLSEMLRVLKVGGSLYILEFSQPIQFLQAPYFYYLENILPKFASLVTKDRSAYEYLSDSIQAFPTKEGFAKEILGAGFKSVKQHSLSGGIVAIHEARV